MASPSASFTSRVRVATGTTQVISRSSFLASRSGLETVKDPGTVFPTKPSYMKRIEFLDDERNLGHCYIVTLHYGWSFYSGEHLGVMGFDTMKDVREAVRDSHPCDCLDECRKLRW